MLIPDEKNSKMLMGWLTRRKVKSKNSPDHISSDRSLAFDARKHAVHTSFLEKISLPNGIKISVNS